MSESNENAWGMTARSTRDLVASTWAKVLRRPRIEPSDNFFDLGGTSLLAARAIGQLERTLTIQIPFILLFELTTLEEFANEVHALLAASRQQAAIAPVAGERPARVPLSLSQQRFWFLDCMHPGTVAYNTQIAIGFTAAIDEAALTEAVRALVQRHEALRTRLRTDELTGIGYQEIWPGDKINLRVEDATTNERTTSKAVETSFLVKELTTPFNLETGPIVRFSLLRLAPDSHMLSIVSHQAVGDAWSNNVMLRDLAELYQSRVEGRQPRLPTVLQYPDYVLRQPAQPDQQKLQRNLSYWLDALKGAPVVLELPSDRARPPVPSLRGARHVFALDAEMTAKLKAFGRGVGATTFMVMLTSFAVLLSRHSGQRDLLIGVPVADRADDATRELVGPMTNTVAVRADLSGGAGFETVLARIRRAVAGGLAHQDIPLERLIEALQPARDMSRQPLFQVVLNFVDFEFADDIPRHWNPVTGHQSTAQFDLTLYVNPSAGGLLLQLEYATDLFDVGTVQRLAEHLRTILREAVTRPAQPVAQLPMLSEAEVNQLLVEWQAAPAEHPISRCVHELFSQQAHRTPEAVALEHNGQTLSYAELDSRSNRFAHHLVAIGVGPEVPVGSCLPRSFDWVISMLAIFKAGGAYVPLDPNYPKERLAHILKTVDLPVILVTAEYAPTMAEIADSDRLHDLAQCNEAIGHMPDGALRVTIRPRNLAYIFFTSGSTGAPKGASVEHAGFTNHVFAKREVLDLGPMDRVAQTSSASFDICVWQLLSPLVCGASVAIIDEDVVADPRQLSAALESTGTTIFQPVPSLLRMLLEGARESVQRLTRLRAIVPTGEALPLDLCVAWFAAAPQSRVVNAYGATECSDDFTHHTMAAAPQGRPSVPIGRPIANCQVLILDSEGGLVPIGVSGEIHAGGLVVGRGYANRPGLTADRFVPSHWSPGTCLYRTGDIGRWRADGLLEFIGRVDHQVKLRGFRIELAEIESVLKENHAVSDAVVLVREDTPGDQRMVAYVTSHAVRPSPKALSDALKSRLPSYMVPQAFVQLDRMPLNVNGKVDRKALPAPDAGGDDERIAGYAAPCTPTEELLAGIWADVLKLDRVGVQDNFFELGGHSLLATQIVARLMRATSHVLALRQIFLHPTIEQLANHLDTNPARALGSKDEFESIERLQRTPTGLD